MKKKKTIKEIARGKFDNMHKRVKENSTYKDVKICEEWQDFDNFLEWFTMQYENKWYRHGRHIDKDLLSPPDQKMYSPETCCFLPPNLNFFLIDSTNKKRLLPPAVQFSRYWGMYYCFFTVGGKNISSNFYTNSKDAFMFYKNYKENMAKEVAEVIKDRIEPRVYDALMTYTINWGGDFEETNAFDYNYLEEYL